MAGWLEQRAAGFGKEATQERSIAAGWAAADGQIAILCPLDPREEGEWSLSSMLNPQKMHQTIEKSWVLTNLKLLTLLTDPSR